MESFQQVWKREALERAVADAMLADESFKSMEKGSPEYEEKMREYMHKLGITGAGPVPNSLLARQDLENGTKKGRSGSAEQSWPLNTNDNKSMVDDTQGKKDETAKSAAVCFACNRAFELLADRYVCPNCGSDSISTGGGRMTVAAKGQVEETKKDLIEMADNSTDMSKTDLAANIKAVQLRRQKATISARAREGDAVGKTFKQGWAAMRQIKKQ